MDYSSLTAVDNMLSEKAYFSLFPHVLDKEALCSNWQRLPWLQAS